jgi:hypothetical protein
MAGAWSKSLRVTLPSTSLPWPVLQASTFPPGRVGLVEVTRNGYAGPFVATASVPGLLPGTFPAS